MKLNQQAMFILTVCTILAGGCKLPPELGGSPLAEPESVVTINKIIEYPRAKKIEKEIATFSDRKIWVNINAFIHSNVIKKIELQPRTEDKGYFDLKLYMNRRGRLRWMQLSSGFKNTPMAFVVDGIFYRAFTPTPLVGKYDNDEDTTFVVIEGPFDPVVAERLKKSAPNNFTYYNEEEND